MIYSSHAHIRVLLGELSMHFNVEAKGKRLLITYGDQCCLFVVFARDLAVVIMVLSTVCATMCYAQLLAGSLCETGGGHG